jgi:hypothetical protein
MSQADHIVPAMPALAMLGDNGGVVTVNPNWCDWYEQVFNQPAGAGYIKGREIMQQIDGTFSEFFTRRSEAVKSAIHSMMEQDPNCPSERFSTIAGAKKSMSTDGKFAMDFNNEEEVFTFDGYFSVKDMEAILFIHRAEALIEMAKKKFGPFIETAAANGGLEHVDVNQLMQVLRPSVEVTDIDSSIFATPWKAESPNRKLMMGGNKSPMAEIFNSVVDAKAALEESGILRQNLTRSATGTLVLDGYFTPKDLEAILYLYRNNDPMVFPAKDANGLPKDKPASMVSDLPESAYAGYADGAVGITEQRMMAGKLAQFSDTSGEQAILPTGNAVLNRMITEGGGLRRGDFMAISAGTDRSKTLLVGGLPMRSFEKGDPDQEMLETLLDRVNNFSTHFPGTPLSVESIQGNFKALEGFGSLFFTKGDQGAICLCRDTGLVKESLISFKAMECSNPEGQIVVIEHDPETVSYDDIKDFIKTFVSLTPERVKATDRAARILAENMPPLHGHQRLDVTGKPMPKFFVTDMVGGIAVEKDLSVLREMETSDFSESLDWITKGYPLSERDDERFVGFTLSDFAKVAAERINRLQNEIHG